MSTEKADALVLLSGGVDSTTVLALLRHKGLRVITVTFDYGQTLLKELKAAKWNSKRYGAAAHLEIPLDLKAVSAGCALLRASLLDLPLDRTLPAIHSSGTPLSYVPFRNGIFFAYLVGLGESLKVPDIYGGCNGLNSGNYYDDTLEFADAFTVAARAGTSRLYQPTIHVPFAAVEKAAIVAEGLRLGVDYRETYSCYRNKRPHCGRCDSCKEREAALGAHGLSIEGERLGAALQS